MIEYDDGDDGKPAAIGKPSKPPIITAEPARNALIERLNHLTFKHWTDGPKIVFNSYGVELDSPNGVQVISGNVSVDVVTQLLHEIASTIPTFYYIGKIEDYQTLRERFPHHELIYLVV